MTPEPTQDDSVLTPDELQLNDDTVADLGENRYLVRSDESPAADAVTGTADAASTDDSSRLTQLESESSDHAHDPRERLSDASEPHGVDITLKTDGEIAHHRAASHDVREVFVDLLTWYASQLDDDMTPSEALQVMLAASDLET
ncbi:hypothetical protein HTZ84_19455 [Haloterrigena sp. SYSU A558-1]|uniref:Uncharacterized protein n=1 Tax=Haloterrigena gelatinilytica TaxID=2741724 RepID=A0ABX2LMX0_9EURY|nr:hypothetical protein [Haloterrigena gelatinilytica]NUC74444.1 hypothetical protein [Haloterrigena gelatinilytica]